VQQNAAELLAPAATILLVALVVAAAVGAWPPFVAVESGSMEPTVERGDLVVVTATDRFPWGGLTGHAEPDAPTRLGGTGDVVVFDPPDADRRPILHRLAFRVSAGEDWTDRADLAQTFLDWSGYAYGSGAEGTHDTQGFARRLTETDVVVQNRDSDEQDILDGNDYYQFQGGALSAIAGLTGREVQAYTPDHGRPGKPVIRSLEQEIARTVRARAANPKWIAGMMRHGYKGAQELAATVDNLFGFAATSRAVEDRHFEMLAEAYLDDPEVRDFLERSNPAAGADIADRLAEALGRGLWQPRSNTWHDKLAALSARWRGRTATNDIQAREEMEP
jgi:cobalamin biosynthesis Mg chelatase CobN